MAPIHVMKSWRRPLVKSGGRIRRSLAAAILLGLAVRGIAGASSSPQTGRFRESFERLLADDGASARFELALHFPSMTDRAPDPPSIPIAPSPPVRSGPSFWVKAANVGTLLGAAKNSFAFGSSQYKFHFTSEGFFGRNTYAGGADKASHFVAFYGVANMLTMIDEAGGIPADRARLLGAAVSDLAGLVIELGDGTSHYGFSYEDLLFDTLGSATALAVAHYGWKDLVGFRWGPVAAPMNPCCRVHGAGENYSKLLFTGDLKIAGLARRAGFAPGPARFLLLSATYGSKGYGYSAPALRERQVGIELGLHVTELMRAARIPEDRWWSKPLYFIFDVFRLPYTAVGFRYDLNHHRWRGPDSGDTFHDPTASGTTLTLSEHPPGS
jgi:hypothetical protein